MREIQFWFKLKIGSPGIPSNSPGDGLNYDRNKFNLLEVFLWSRFSRSRLALWCTQKVQLPPAHLRHMEPRSGCVSLPPSFKRKSRHAGTKRAAACSKNLPVWTMSTAQCICWVQTQALRQTKTELFSSWNLCCSGRQGIQHNVCSSASPEVQDLTARATAIGDLFKNTGIWQLIY